MENNEMIQEAPAETAEAALTAIKPANTGTVSVWQDKDAFNQLLRMADMLSKSSLVPQTYQGRPQDCFVALEYANRIGITPLYAMQNLYVVKGKPSWSGQACMALIKASGAFDDVRLVYTGTKGTDNRGCYVTALRRSDGQQVDGTEITISMAKAEGWTSNSKWRSMPEQMLGYRAAAFFARLHCPEALMGLQTAEEVYDAEAKPQTAARALSEKLKGGISSDAQ